MPVRMPNLKEWRERARMAFKVLGRGKQAQCARDLGISPSQLSETINESIDPNVTDRSSQYIPEINEWLRRHDLDFPTMISLSPDAEELVELMDGISDLEKTIIRRMRDAEDPFAALVPALDGLTTEQVRILTALATELAQSKKT